MQRPRHPATPSVFSDWHIQFCCGGGILWMFLLFPFIWDLDRKSSFVRPHAEQILRRLAKESEIRCISNRTGLFGIWFWANRMRCDKNLVSHCQHAFRFRFIMWLLVLDRCRRNFYRNVSGQPFLDMPNRKRAPSRCPKLLNYLNWPLSRNGSIPHAN